MKKKVSSPDLTELRHRCKRPRPIGNGGMGVSDFLAYTRALEQYATTLEERIYALEATQTQPEARHERE